MRSYRETDEHNPGWRAGIALGLTALVAACASSSLGAGTSSTRASTSSASAVSTGAPSSSAATSGPSTSTTRTSTATSSGSGSPTSSVDDALGELRDGNLSSFLAALRAAGLLGDLSARPVTIFAPNNDAFAALGADTVRSWASDPSKATAVLRNHVVEGTWPASRLATSTSLTALSGRTLTVSASGGSITVDGAHVVNADDASGAVVVHVIDRVLTGSTS